MSIFINHSNHPSENWSSVQRAAALEYGSIVDLDFPMIKSDLDEGDVLDAARKTYEQIVALKPSVVLCQGEYTYTYELVKLLKQAGITVVAACSERRVREEQEGDVSRKVSYFQFVRFRKY